MIDLEAPVFALLQQACHGHSNGQMEADPVACSDADRLDPGRVGIYPNFRRLCTAMAKQPVYIEKAWRWSRREARQKM